MHKQSLPGTWAGMFGVQEIIKTTVVTFLFIHIQIQILCMKQHMQFYKALKLCYFTLNTDTAAKIIYKIQILLKTF